jgi:hypothetical protein
MGLAPPPLTSAIIGLGRHYQPQIADGGRASWRQLRRQQKSVGIFLYNPCTDLSIEWEVVEYHGTDEGDLTGLGEQDLLLIYGVSDRLFFLLTIAQTTIYQI